MMQLRKDMSDCFKHHRLVRVGLLSLIGVILNLIGSHIATVTGLPIFLDSIGTVLVAAVSGMLPGIAVGFFTNIFKKATSDFSSIYYGVINVLIAIVASFFSRKGFFKKIRTLFAVVLSLALVGGGLGSVLTWFLL